MAEQWLSIVEYARTFKVSDMTVRRRIKTGRLHAVLKEGKYFIPVPADSGERRSPYAASMPPPAAAPSPPAPSPYLRRPGEMTVIKGHSAAQSAQAAYAPMPAELRALAPAVDETVRDSVVPVSLTRPLVQQETSLVDTRALLAFCDATLRKVNDSERRTVEKFKSKLEALEANLVVRDQEIRTLRQQVEDLQVLVKILERK